MTTELSAVGVNRDRDLPSFFIKIGISSTRGRLAEIAGGKKKLASAKTRLRYPKGVFRAIESLATSVTSTLKVDSLFTVIEITPAVRRNLKAESDSLSTKGTTKTSARSGSRSLSENVTIELGDFDSILAALESMREDVEDKQAKDKTMFCLYLYCTNALNEMLEPMDRTQPSNALGKAIINVGLNEHRVKYDFTIREVDPALLVESGVSVGLGGVAGAGKTSLSRIITKVAIERGLKCIYFPCSRIESKADKLTDCVADYLRSINAIKTRQDMVLLFQSLDLIVIDGCDKAATFDTKKLVQEIRDLHHRRSEPVEYKADASQDLTFRTSARHNPRISARRP